MRSRIALVVAVLVATSVLGIGRGPSARAAGCGLSGFDGTRTIGGRSYVLHVPAGLTGTQVPLLVTLHGLSNDGQMHADQTGWEPFADTHNFIVAFPNGDYRSWNWSQWGAGDIQFLRNVVADISSTWCIDAHRVYISGHSNGAFMSQRVACDAPDLFASATEYAGGPPDATFYPCNPSRGIAVGLYHGDWDTLVPEAWGEQARDGWVSRLTCNSTPTSEATNDGQLLRYTGCRDGVDVLWRTYPQQTHLWPGGTRQQDILDSMWSFLQAHPLP